MFQDILKFRWPQLALTHHAVHLTVRLPERARLQLR